MIKNIFHGDEFSASIPEHNFLNNLPNHNNTDFEYHNLLIQILETGIWKENRTSEKTLSIFGPQLKFEKVGEKFPLLTTKKIHIKSIIGELLWFLSGSTNKHELRDKYGVTIWDEWGDNETGELGPIYGNQWVNWEYFGIEGLAHYGINPEKVREPRCDGLLYGQRHIKKSINQIQNLIDTLKTDPDDRRMIVSAWHVDQISDMALPPCHWSFQFYTNQYPDEKKRRLHIKVNIRSWDAFLGAPFNIASYALFLMMMAQEVNMEPGDLIISAGDAHIYKNHIKYICEQLGRKSMSLEPIMFLNKKKDFWNFTPDDFDLQLYKAYPNWKHVPVAV